MPNAKCNHWQQTYETKRLTKEEKTFFLFKEWRMDILIFCFELLQKQMQKRKRNKHCPKKREENNMPRSKCTE